MIYHKIYIKEQVLKKKLEKKDKKKLEALNSIKELLSKVDNSAEVIPATNYRKLSLMLSFLKGDRLNRYEKLVLREIIDA